MHNQPAELLEKAKEMLKEEVTVISYGTWIRTLEMDRITGNTIYLRVNSIQHGDMIQNKFKELLITTFNLLTNKNYDIAVVTPEDYTSIDNVTLPTPTSIRNNLNSSLNKKYTFDTFVVGSNNRFAHAAALAVAEAPGQAYNPLFLYGGVGLGKTHLMHAIGNYVADTNNEKKVVYVTSENFTNEFINGIKDNTNDEFRNKYRNIDVLLIDDIQFIAGKERIQEEFFHTFNALHEGGKQIIISSDKPPKDIDHLEDRLKSRFEWGLIADVSKADYETRLAILRKKVQLENFVVDDLILSNIATRVDSNIRELEGTLNKIMAKAHLTHSPVTVEFAEACIDDVISKKEKVMSSDYIQQVVSKYFNINEKDMTSSKRSNDVAYPRQIAMYLCRDIADLSYKQIGLDFGKRDHTTVMHACNKIESEIKNDVNNTKAIVESVRNIILNKQ